MRHVQNKKLSTGALGVTSVVARITIQHKQEVSRVTILAYSEYSSEAR